MLLDTLIQIGLYLTTVINIILTIVIFSRSREGYSNFIFALVTLTTAIWSIAIIGFYYPPIDSVTIDWIDFTHSAGLTVSMLFLYFSVIFPQNFLTRGKVFYLGLPLLALTFFIIQIFLSNSVVGETFESTYELGPLYIWYAMALIAGFFVGYFFLFKQFKHAKNSLQKKQVLYVALGTAIASILAIIPNLVFPYFGIFEFTWSGPLFTLIMIVAIFVAMTRFHLFNIKIILTEVFAGTIIITLLAQLFTAQSDLGVWITTLVLVLVSISSFLLIKSVYREVEQREEIERLAENLEKANVKLTQADKMKTKLMSIASHDLRSPLGAIKGYASMMTEGSFGKLSEGGKEAAGKIFEVAERMNGIVEDFLNVSRIEQGRLKYDFEIADLVKLAHERAQEQAPQAEEKDLELTFESSQPSFMVSMDVGKMEQIVNNLIDNAVKYTPKGSVHVSVKESGEDMVRLTVEDTGVGIPPEAKESLFKEFSRLEGGEKQNRGGTGLGLYIAKVMIEAHKGKIWAESEGENMGSRFIIELPVSS